MSSKTCLGPASPRFKPSVAYGSVCSAGAQQPSTVEATKKVGGAEKPGPPRSASLPRRSALG